MLEVCGARGVRLLCNPRSRAFLGDFSGSCPATPHKKGCPECVRGFGIGIQGFQNLLDSEGRKKQELATMEPVAEHRQQVLSS